MFLKVIVSLGFLAGVAKSSLSPRPYLHHKWTTVRHHPGFSTDRKPWLQVRGGDLEDEDDSERYSRQVYTLGARAHGLIRSSTVYLDGPPSSGLLYECAKNLALSGVRHLVVVTSTGRLQDEAYHNAPLDDLGCAYQRAARSEVVENDENGVEDLSDAELLMEYLRRLNPNIQVSMVSRDNLGEMQEKDYSKRRILLCVDRPSSTQSTLNRVAREHNLAFVAVETSGVFGRTFCDFGPSFVVHDADGEMPLVTPFNSLEAGEKDSDVVVHTVTGEKHDVSKGDEIQFQFRNGEFSAQRCTVTDVQNPYRFTVKLKPDHEKEEFITTVNSDAASFRRVKVPQEVKFQPFDKALASAKEDPSMFAACDLEKSFDAVRRDASMACFQAASSFAEEHGRLPSLADEATFVDLVNEANQSVPGASEGGGHCMAFLKGCAAKFSPFQAVFGAIGAQEALKAATGLYFPVRQFLLYDCDEVFDGSTDSSKHDTTVCSSSQTPQAPGLRYILGDKTVEKLQTNRIFVVGAGAIGCEILKNLAAMGVGTGKGGRIILTDMDTIEKSNLSRQLLFRDSNIGDFKSSAAEKAARRFNSDMRIEAHSSKVGGEGHSPFDEKFWSKKVHTVLNALDNVEARLYMDSQCVANQKALVDAGTMGPKGNVQVVVPHQSESYSSSVDPPEPAIAVCTLKNFPYAISHTIQWGRDLFDGLFDRRPVQANDFRDAMQSNSAASLTSRLLHEKGEDSAIEASLELNEDLKDTVLSDSGEMKDASLKWAAELAFALFFKASKDLLEKHPLDSVDEDGETFWSGTRRPPKALELLPSPADPEQELINANLLEFVRGAARLRWETLSGSLCTNPDDLFSIDDAKEALYMQSFSTNEAETPNQAARDIIRKNLEEASTHVHSKPMSALEFEKDDDSNGHVAFVTAASNLRAICYGIPPVDKMETRRVAGNIVPAMISTTAFVSALSCIEFVKLAQGSSLRTHRNAFINLALPFFAFTVPVPAEKVPGVGGKTYTLWDRLVVKEKRKAAAAGGITMKSFIRKIKKMVADESDSVDVSTVSFGQFMLFANFLHADEKDLLNKPIQELIADAVADSQQFEAEFSRDNDAIIASDIPLEGESIDLTVVVEDLETGDEVELPTVQVKRRKSSGSKDRTKEIL